ncbi:sulfatase-like hydrolase/transferase [bacterium]|nr:sulfatase-like hydrolase/transferase [bacterium]
MKSFIPIALLVGSALSVSAQAPRPNIVLIMADDMGWGDPSYNSNTVSFANGTPHPDRGWINTPVMDEMAVEGIRFDRFYSGSAVCAPTRASCLTGRNPIRVGIPFANVGRLEFDETPLSEVLSDVGYSCGHFGKWHLGSMTTLRNDSNRGEVNSPVYSAPWHHGYDFCYATESKVPTFAPYVNPGTSNFYGTRYWRMPATFNEVSGEGEAVPFDEINDHHDGDSSLIAVEQAVSFVESSIERGEPFFVVLWFHTPHKPVVDPNGNANVDSSTALIGAIEDMDEAIGVFRDELDRLAVRDNTMLWLTSDNGPEDGINSPNESSTSRSIRSGRYLARKRSLHEGGLRVPGILEWPAKISTPFATSFPAVTSDYYPTILDYLQLAVPDQKPIDGISLRPVIEGENPVRTSPIGFKIINPNTETVPDVSWVNEQYKLIDDNGTWELYDLLNVSVGQEVEQTPIATENNISSQSQAIQDVYNTMLAEFTAWDTSIENDTPYVHSSQPSCVLTTPEADVDDVFTVAATFSEPVAFLELNEIIVSNGTATNLSGGGTSWTVEVAPSSPGIVEVQVPAGAANDPDGNPNVSASPLEVSFQFMPLPDPTGDPVSIVSSLPLSLYQTVDSVDDAPADGSNNVLKFTMGTVNDGVSNPFTTDLYIRGSSSDNIRRVNAHLLFDLSALGNVPVRSARIEFHGHSLNDNLTDNIDILAQALASAWSTSVAPTYNHPGFGPLTSGGSVVADLDADHTRDYEIDLTEAARNWVTGAEPNFGIRLTSSNASENNGLGIELGSGGPMLVVEQAPLQFTDMYQGPAEGAVTLVWNSAPGYSYAVQASNSLEAGSWQTLASVPGSESDRTVWTESEAIPTNSFRFYRIGLLED